MADNVSPPVCLAPLCSVIPIRGTTIHCGDLCGRTLKGGIFKNLDPLSQQGNTRLAFASKIRELLPFGKQQKCQPSKE